MRTKLTLFSFFKVGPSIRRFWSICVGSAYRNESVSTVFTFMKCESFFQFKFAAFQITKLFPTICWAERNQIRLTQSHYGVNSPLNAPTRNDNLFMLKRQNDRKLKHRDKFLTKSNYWISKPSAQRLTQKNTNQKYDTRNYKDPPLQAEKDPPKFSWDFPNKYITGDKENMHFNAAITHVYLPTAPIQWAHKV